MESNEEWVTPKRALELLQFTLGYGAATEAICTRAHDGVVRTRALRYIEANKGADNVDIPAKFWWARGKAALTQNWNTGDFETWIDQRVHLRAYGVQFLRADIERMIPDDDSAARRRKAPFPPLEPSGSSASAAGGRPPADWWEDLLIDLCFQHFRGELEHKTQAAIVRAMQDWISTKGYEAAESTIKIRARKLADAIKRDAAEN